MKLVTQEKLDAYADTLREAGFPENQIREILQSYVNYENAKAKGIRLSA